MIHSPRRLTPKLRNEHEGPLINSSLSPVRDAPGHPSDTARISKLQTTDESLCDPKCIAEEERSSKELMLPFRSAQGPQRKPTKNRPEALDVSLSYSSHVISKSPIRVSSLQKSSMSSLKSLPSTGTTLSSVASRSTSDSNSTCTTDSESSPKTTEAPLPPLQSWPSHDYENLDPLSNFDLEVNSFDLVVPPDLTADERPLSSLETRSELLLSSDHLKIIFSDPSLLLKFTSFLSVHRVSSIPMLVYYLDSIKALKAISYANAIAEALDPIPGHDFTTELSTQTRNVELEEKSNKAFEVLVREDLPAYVTHVYTQTVSQSIQRRITGTLPPHLVEASEGLAEVFCMTDPSRPDNPIIFSSEEFHRSTQYGLPYVIGRNCRFLQGPKTNPFSVKRIREKVDAGIEHCEVILNYRRDGSPFMNLFMCAPLCDSKGNIRYFIGAQVDVSGLVKECSELESFKRLVAQAEKGELHPSEEVSRDEFKELSEMLNLQELETVRICGGKMHKKSQESIDSDNTGYWSKPRVLINPGSLDGTQDYSPTHGSYGGKLRGIYENYLLIRPYPSLRILFASPSLRVPGILQSPFMSKIGGSQRVRDELMKAFSDGHGVTAKVKWVSKADPEGRNRWIHCTPLIGRNSAIGVWMVVIVDDEHTSIRRTQRMAPPVDPSFGRGSYSPTSDTSQKDLGLKPKSLRHVPSLREESLRIVPDSPFSTVTFNLGDE
ncbi:hypothetical protein K3495_g11885 [Podosphaera aphanis]|nr:hypothetical protein K3495_g11885 [Podosphaera aphanis]